jgi:DNA-binding transcriptional LysR family regulator
VHDVSSFVPDPWLGVEPRHLATFVAVADARSFRGAAARLGYVQSAVSQQIVQLEQALSTRLIERGTGNRAMTLTPQGRHLLGHARKIVDQMRAASADIAYLLEQRPVRIAVEPAATPLLPRLTKRIKDAHPNDEFVLLEVPSRDQPGLLLEGEVDLGAGSFGQLPHGIRDEPFDSDQWALVMPADAAAPSTPPCLEMLRDRCLIEDRTLPLPPGFVMPPVARTVHCDRTATVLNLVRANVGVALLPSLATRGHEAGLRVVPLGDRIPARVVSLVWLRGRRVPTPAEYHESAHDREHASSASRAVAA